MAELNITMKQLNNQGQYDTLYPQTTGENIQGLTFDQVEGSLDGSRVSGIYTADETLSTATKTALGLNSDATPDDAFEKLNQDVSENSWQIGDTLTTARTDLGSDWLLCDGSAIDLDNYSELASFFSVNIWDSVSNAFGGYGSNNVVADPISGMKYAFINNTVYYGISEVIGSVSLPSGSSYEAYVVYAGEMYGGILNYSNKEIRIYKINLNSSYIPTGTVTQVATIDLSNYGLKAIDHLQTLNFTNNLFIFGMYSNGSDNVYIYSVNKTGGTPTQYDGDHNYASSYYYTTVQYDANSCAIGLFTNTRSYSWLAIGQGTNIYTHEFYTNNPPVYLPCKVETNYIGAYNKNGNLYLYRITSTGAYKENSLGKPWNYVYSINYYDNSLYLASGSTTYKYTGTFSNNFNTSFSVFLSDHSIPTNYFYYNNVYKYAIIRVSVGSNEYVYNINIEVPRLPNISSNYSEISTYIKAR